MGGGELIALLAGVLVLWASGTDYISTARPQNSVFDIGAYEYIVSAGGGSGGMSQTPAWDSPRRSPFWKR